MGGVGDRTYNAPMALVRTRRPLLLLAGVSLVAALATALILLVRLESRHRSEQAAADYRALPSVHEPAIPDDATAQGQGDLFWVLEHPDPAIPDPVAIVNGRPLSLDAYWGAYSIPYTCTRNQSCSGADLFKRLGVANVAFTIAVDHLLVEQYGRTHGVAVSEADIDEALQRESDGMQRALAQGGVVARSIQENLALMHLVDPAQMPADPSQRDYMRILLLRSKTYERFAPIRPVGDRSPAQEDFELRLQKQAKVQPRIQAQLLDPHQLLVPPSPPTLPNPPPIPPNLPILAPPGEAIPVGTPPPVFVTPPGS